MSEWVAIKLIIFSNLLTNFLIQILYLSKFESSTSLDLYYSYQAAPIIVSGFVYTLLQAAVYKFGARDYFRTGKIGNIFIWTSAYLVFVNILLLPFLILLNFVLFVQVDENANSFEIFVICLAYLFQSLAFVWYAKCRASGNLLYYECVWFCINIITVIIVLSIDIVSILLASFLILFRFAFVSLPSIYFFYKAFNDFELKLNKKLCSRLIKIVAYSLPYKATSLLDKIIIMNFIGNGVALINFAQSIVGAIVQIVDKSYVVDSINHAQLARRKNIRMFDGSKVYAISTFLFILVVIVVSRLYPILFNNTLNSFYDSNHVANLLLILSICIFINSHNMYIVSLLNRFTLFASIAISGAIGVACSTLIKIKLSMSQGIYGFAFGVVSYYLIIYIYNLFILNQSLSVYKRSQIDLTKHS